MVVARVTTARIQRASPTAKTVSEPVTATATTVLRAPLVLFAPRASLCGAPTCVVATAIPSERAARKQTKRCPKTLSASRCEPSTLLCFEARCSEPTAVETKRTAIQMACAARRAP